MKAITAIAAAILCVSAGPPVEYRQQSAGFVMFLDDVSQVCPQAEGEIVLSCVREHETLGLVLILPNPCAFDEEVYARLACAEKARALGWRE